MLSQTLNMKPLILSTLSQVSRPGIDPLIQFLQSSDFFQAPASTRFHAAYPGGLAEHSLNVYRLFKDKIKTYDLDIPEESIILCGLLHDVCKTGLYVKGKKNVKESGKWIEKEIWECKDSLPFGHGEKSVYILQQYIKLTELEAMTIRWHMGFSEPKELWRLFDAAREKYPSVMALFLADLESSFLLEVRKMLPDIR